MNNGDYFFLIFLGTIAVTRVLLLSKVAGPTIKGFRVRHYMYGIILIIISFFIQNLPMYALGLGLLIDELPPVLVKGPGHKSEYWRGCEDYYSPWCVAGVMVLILIVYFFRDSIAGLI